MKKTRNSSLELLKLISMAMIVISHATPDGDTSKFFGAVDINLANQNLQVFITTLFHNLGQIGNAIFIACSSYFLLDSTKTNTKKILHIIGDCFAISVLMFVPFWIFSDYKFSTFYMVKQFFPVTFGNNWFIPCYLMFYAIHPFLNTVINKMEKRTHLTFNIMFILMYCVLNFSFSGLFFYNRFIGFIGIYFIMAYIKNYLPETSSSLKINLSVFFGATLGWLILMFLTNISGHHIMSRWNSLVNPFFIAMGLSAFNIAKNHTFYNKFINYISSLTLYIYLIHCNRVIRDCVRFTIYGAIKTHFGYDNLVLWILIYSIICFIASTILAVIYNLLLRKPINKVFEKIGGLISLVYGKLVNLILKLK